MPTPSVVQWKPLVVGYIKINFDASVTCNPPCIGLGAVARSHTGEVIAWSRRRVQYIQDPELAEAMATILAVNLAISLQHSQFEIESDCLNLVKMLQSTDPCLAPCGVFVDLIRNIVPNFGSLVFLFIPRLGNTLAHSLAHNVSEDADGGNTLPQL